MNSVVLTAQNLTIGYVHSRTNKTVIAQGLNLEMHTQELVCLVGPNGVGKSTLLRTLTSLQPKLSALFSKSAQLKSKKPWIFCANNV